MNFTRRRFLLECAAASFLAGCGGTLPNRSSWERRRFEGVAVFRFEFSEFVEAGTCEPPYEEARYDVCLAAKDPDVIGAFRDLGILGAPWGAALVTLDGRLSPLGRYGHLGGWKRELFVERVITIRRAPRCT